MQLTFFNKEITSNSDDPKLPLKYSIKVMVICLYDKKKYKKLLSEKNNWMRTSQDKCQ